MGRRSNGEGTLYKRTDSRWAGSVYVTVAGGNRKRVTVYGGTREEAHRKLLRVLDRSRSGIVLPSKQWRVGDYIDYWLTLVEVTRRPLTYIQYESLCRLYLRPSLGAKLLAELSVADLQQHFDRQRRASVGGRTIQKQRTVLSALLTQAQREDLITRNVARLVLLPTSERKEIRPWTASEVGRFLKVAEDSRFYEAFLMLCLYGLRRGEVLGLRWRDVDVVEGVIHVRQQVQSIHGRLSLEPLKTRASRRTLPLVEVVRTALDNRYSGLTPEPSPDDLIFKSLNDTPVDPKKLLAALYRLCDQHQLPRITLHHLRHTAATLLKKLGVPARDAQLILGHSNISTTQEIYQHGDVHTQRVALGRLARLVVEAGGRDHSRQILPSSDESGPSSGSTLTSFLSGAPRWIRTTDLRLRSYEQHRKGTRQTEKIVLVGDGWRLRKVGSAAVKYGCQSPAGYRHPAFVRPFGSSSTGIHKHPHIDPLLKSLAKCSGVDALTPVSRHLRARTRALILGRVATDLGTSGSLRAAMTAAHSDRQLYLAFERAIASERLRTLSFPYSLVPQS